MNSLKITGKLKQILIAVLLIAVLFFMYSFIQDTVFEIGFLICTEEQISSLSYYFFDAISCGILCILLYILYVYIIKKDLFQIKERSVSSWWKVLPIAVVITFGASYISQLWLNFAYTSLAEVPVFAESMQSYDTAWSTIEQDPYIWVFLSVVLLGPIVEELLFRGLIFNLIKKSSHAYIAIILSGVLFGLWHMELIQVIYTMIVGVILAVVYEYSGSLFVTVGMHVLYNFTSTLPPSLNNDAAYELINLASEMLLIPTIILLIYISVQIYFKYSYKNRVHA